MPNILSNEHGAKLLPDRAPKSGFWKMRAALKTKCDATKRRLQALNGIAKAFSISAAGIPTLMSRWGRYVG